MYNLENTLHNHDLTIALQEHNIFTNEIFVVFEKLTDLFFKITCKAIKNLSL